MTDEILSDRRGQILLLTLNRPELGNRITAGMAGGIVAALDENAPERPRAVVITGAGDSFCLGGDFTAEGNLTEVYLSFSRNFVAMSRAVQSAPVPVIAAVNGNAHAGGFSLLTCCDIVLMSEDATLALPELQHGLFPILAMATIRPLLPRPVFFDLVYRGRTLTAEEAVRYGLATEVVSADRVRAAALEVGAELAELRPTAIRIGRQTYNAMSAMTDADALEHARYVLPTLLSATAGRTEDEGPPDE